MKRKPDVSCEQVMEELRAMAKPGNLAGMSRYGICTQQTLGVSIPKLRSLARRLGRDHALALDLWATGVHEARILAALVDEPSRVDAGQMDAWASEFDSWDVCDQVCANLFDRTPYAWDKALEWAERDQEFVKRAAFALMAALAWHDKAATDERFLAFLPVIAGAADDERNFVKKAVNWALRGIGKRSRALNAAAVATAAEIEKQGSRSARWIAKDALRELSSEAVQKRLGGTAS